MSDSQASTVTSCIGSSQVKTDIPIIFITGYGDVPTSVQAMKAGAFDFLTKPLKSDMLLAAITHALERSRAALVREAEMDQLRTRYASLTPRERDVMALVVSALLNKQVGGELGISEITVKAHRGHVMRKMKAASLPALVTMAARLGGASGSDTLTAHDLGRLSNMPSGLTMAESLASHRRFGAHQYQSLMDFGWAEAHSLPATRQGRIATRLTRAKHTCGRLQVRAHQNS
jgi:DNA-binding NarL/FixJ family response regulator